MLQQSKRPRCKIANTSKYFINKNGEVIGQRGVIKPYVGLGGYLAVNLYVRGARKAFYVHRLVALHFVHPFDGQVVNHIDENKLNNSASNLEWVSQSKNVLHSYEKRSTRKSVLQINLISGEKTIWKSITEASKKGGFNRSAISACLKGRRKNHKNSLWKEM